MAIWWAHYPEEPRPRPGPRSFHLFMLLLKSYYMFKFYWGLCTRNKTTSSFAQILMACFYLIFFFNIQLFRCCDDCDFVLCVYWVCTLLLILNVGSQQHEHPQHLSSCLDSFLRRLLSLFSFFAALLLAWPHLLLLFAVSLVWWCGGFRCSFCVCASCILWD